MRVGKSRKRGKVEVWGGVELDIEMSLRGHGAPKQTTRGSWKRVVELLCSCCCCWYVVGGRRGQIAVCSDGGVVIVVCFDAAAVVSRVGVLVLFKNTKVSLLLMLSLL